MGDDKKVKRVIRFDVGTLRPPVETPQGFLRVDGHAGRCGIYEYTNEDGTIRRELRPTEEVFKAKALDGFEGASCTDGHPMVPVTRDNVRQYEVGSASAGRRDGDNVLTPMILKDAAIITKVNKARKEGRAVELSPGYALDLEMTPGMDKRYAYPGNPDGRYDAIQRNIEINHLAVLADPGSRARGGAGMRMRLDGADADVSTERPHPQFAFGDKMPVHDSASCTSSMDAFGSMDFGAKPGAKKDAFQTIVSAAKSHGLDSTNFEQEYGGHLDDMIVVAVDPDGDELGDDNSNTDQRGNMADKNPTINEDALKVLEAQRINLDQQVRTLTEENVALKLRADTADGKLAEVQKDIPALRAELAQAKTASETVAVLKERVRADAAEDALRKLNADRAVDIRKRVSLERQCAPSLGDAFRMDTLSDRALMCMTLKKLDAHADTSDAVPEGIIIGRFQAAIERRDANASALAQVSQVMDVNRREQARQDHQRDQRAEWQKPLPNSKFGHGGNG